MGRYRVCLAAFAAVWTIGGSGAGWTLADEPPKEPPPEILTKVTDVLTKAAVRKRTSFDTLMHDEIAAVVKSVGLSPEGIKALEASAAQAEDAAQDDFTASGLQHFRQVYAVNRVASLEWIGKPNAVDMVVSHNGGLMGGEGHYTGPLDQPGWKDGIVRVLRPEQIIAWDQAKAEKKKAVAKAVADYVSKQVDRTRQQLEPSMLAESGEIIAALSLPKERSDQVNDLAKKATDASVAAWRQAAETAILSNDEAQRNATLKNKNFYLPFNAKDAPAKQAVWTEGVAKLLTDDERARVQVARASRKARRVHAVGQLIVALLDDKIAFTDGQRPRLERVIEPLAQAQADFFPTGENDNYYAVRLDNIYKTIARAKPEDVQPILDDLQWKHWQAIKQNKNAGNDDDEDESSSNTTPANPDVGAGEPEDMEQAMSDYLQARAATHYKRLESVMALAAEDASRITRLEPVHAARLQTAARGAAESTLAAWEPSLEQNTRSEAKGATRENIQQRLANGSRYYYERVEPKDQAIWKATVAAELTPAQQTAWTVERDARSHYNDNAIAGFMLAEFDRKFSLLPEQWEKLAPTIAKVMQDYRSDISGWFSSFNSPWYLSSYYMFLPMQAVPENDVKALLSREQWDRWTGSREYNYTSNYWPSIRQNHDQRVKQKKP